MCSDLDGPCLAYVKIVGDLRRQLKRQCEDQHADIQAPSSVQFISLSVQPYNLTVQGAEGVSGGSWSANWAVTKSSKCAYLYQRLLAIGAALPLHKLGVNTNTNTNPYPQTCPM